MWLVNVKSTLWECNSIHSVWSNAGRRSSEEERHPRKEVYLAKSDKLTLAGSGLKNVLSSLHPIKQNISNNMIVIFQSYNNCNYNKVLEISY